MKTLESGIVRDKEKMTREEVIVELQMMLLRHVNDDGSSIFDNAEIEAIHSAIDAL